MPRQRNYTVQELLPSTFNPVYRGFLVFRELFVYKTSIFLVKRIVYLHCYV
jgi:hypothetical protein